MIIEFLSESMRTFINFSPLLAVIVGSRIASNIDGLVQAIKIHM